MLHTPLETVLTTVGNTFSHVEIICEGNHTNYEVLESFDFTVSFHAPFSDLNIASLNNKILKESLTQISKAIENASTYNATAVCIHPGHISPLGMHFKEKVRATQIASLKQLSKIAEECTIVLGVENMPYFPTLTSRTPQEVTSILDAVNSDHVKFTFDVGHAQIKGDITQFLALKDVMVLIHLHDNNGDQDTHLAVGDGILDVPFIKKLPEVFIIEVNTYINAVKSLHRLQTAI
jgi:sugar phosphate isomerase/epimerase